MSICLHPQHVGVVGGISLCLSLLSIVPDDDISVGFRPFHKKSKLSFKASSAVDTEDDRGRSIRKTMAEIVIMFVFL